MGQKQYRIWTFVDYNMLPIHGTLNRHYNLGMAMKKRGHNVTVFVGSHPHNTNLQLINGKEKYRIFQTEPFPWVLVKTLNYEDSRMKRVLSMFLYYINAKKAAKEFEKPDVIIGSSAHPLCALLAIRLAKKYKAKSIVEIRDLWPESIVAMGVAKKSNPIIKFLYWLERKMYQDADAVIFTCEGGYDYIEMKGWSSVIPRSKVYYINNGINIKDFDSNVENNRLDDKDLESGKFLIVYTGAIKLANGLERLIDCAKLLKGKEGILFLVYGDGDFKDDLEKRCKEENISNVHFKGRVEKRFVPYILSKSSVNLLNYNTAVAGLYRFGSSQNKLFDYLASGKPVISNTKINYDIIKKYDCGISKNLWNAKDYVKELMKIYEMPKSEYDRFCNNARKASYDFDFSMHAERLENICRALVG